MVILTRDFSRKPTFFLDAKSSNLVNFLNIFVITMMVRTQGPVVRKPISANHRLKDNRGFHLTRYKCFYKLISSLWQREV